ncbi:MAG: integrase arm-type DNA-binding domain-containing protein [Gammaproteobacteria bacterium]
MLSDTKIRNSKPREKPYKLFDGQGLYLLIKSKSQRWWRFKYQSDGKEKLLSLGIYPDVSLKQAREKRDELRRNVAAGIDPSLQRRAMQQADASSFEGVAREWHAKRLHTWTQEHAARILRRLEKDIFPWVGTRPIAELIAPEVLAVLRRIESRSVLDTAHRALQNCSAVFRYAVATGRASRDPCADLRGALPPTRGKHHAAITEPQAVGELLRAIEGYQGSLITKCALQLSALVFVRPGELRRAEWSEIDFTTSEWRIPAGKMKARALHIVPLSQQAVATLRELQPLTGSGRYVFPSVRTADRPMSENTITGALRRLGYTKHDMTAHGFRSLASTLLNEQGWSRDAIERQLAHAERDATRAAYNRAEYLTERRKMMQSWAEYLDGLRKGADVVSIRSRMQV